MAELTRSPGLPRRTLMAGLVLAAAAAGAGAVSRSSSLDVADFRHPGMDDRAVLAAALRGWQRVGGGALHLEPDWTYDLGAIASTGNLFEVSGIEGGALIGNGARIVAESANRNVWNLFSFANIRGLRIVDLAFHDRGYRDGNWGMKALVFQPGISGVEEIELQGIVGDRLLSLVQAQGPFLDAPRVRGIVFRRGCAARQCYYALCCQEQGDAVTGTLHAIDCRRAYLAFGVTGHRLNLSVHLTSARPVAYSRNPVLIKAYDRPTTDLSLAIRFSGALTYEGSKQGDRGACVMLEDQSESGTGMLANIDLLIDIRGTRTDRIPPYLVAFSHLSRQGKPIPARANRWRNVAIDARIDRAMAITAPELAGERLDVRLSGDVANILTTDLINPLPAL